MADEYTLTWADMSNEPLPDKVDNWCRGLSDRYKVRVGLVRKLYRFFRRIEDVKTILVIHEVNGISLASAVKKLEEKKLEASTLELVKRSQAKAEGLFRPGDKLMGQPENSHNPRFIAPQPVVCKNCNELTPEGASFCDSECRDDFQKRVKSHRTTWRK